MNLDICFSFCRDGNVIGYYDERRGVFDKMVREEFFEKVNLVELLEKVRNRFGKFKEE